MIEDAFAIEAWDELLLISTTCGRIAFDGGRITFGYVIGRGGLCTFCFTLKDDWLMGGKRTSGRVGTVNCI